MWKLNSWEIELFLKCNHKYGWLHSFNIFECCSYGDLIIAYVSCYVCIVSENLEFYIITS